MLALPPGLVQSNVWCNPMHALRASHIFIESRCVYVLSLPSRRLLPRGGRSRPEPDLLAMPRGHLQPRQWNVDDHLVPLMPSLQGQPRAPIDCGLGMQSMPSRFICCAKRHGYLRPVPERQVHVDVGQHSLPAVHAGLPLHRGLERAAALPGRHPRQPDRAQSHRLPRLPERVHRLPCGHELLRRLRRAQALPPWLVQQPVAAGDVHALRSGLL